MWQIQTINKIDSIIHQIMGKENYFIADDVAEPDAILVRSAKLHDLELPKSLLAIARAGAGTNNIPIDRCTEKGIVVFNTPGANANAVAELVIAGIIIASRNIAAATFWLTAQPKDENLAAAIEKGKSQFVGGEIAGKNIGLIGLGAIGILVAQKAAALGMTVYGYDPFISEAAKNKLDKQINLVTNRDELFKKCCFISLHLPTTAETKGSFNAEVFQKFNDNTILLNFARGDLINSGNLLTAIANGKILHYITDFPSADLIDNPHITPIPHLGASCPEAETNCATMAAAQTVAYLENGNIINSVNFPNCSLADNKQNRLSIAYNTEKNTEKEILAHLAGFTNKAGAVRQNTGYILADFASAQSEEKLAELKKLDGILLVRSL
jgi:D-3-phosphoglycerate dehydrogenase